tara:strand:- start:417 stop:1931 length:1515 start_codon:yes stop_codon:yes gene_type:complete
MSINEKIDIAVDGIGTKAGEFDISTAGETLILDHLKSELSELGITDEVLGNLKSLEDLPAEIKSIFVDGTGSIKDAVTAISSGDVAGLKNALTSVASLVCRLVPVTSITITYDSDGFPSGSESSTVASSTASLTGILETFTTIENITNGDLQNIVTTGNLDGIIDAQNAGSGKVAGALTSLYPIGSTDSDKADIDAWNIGISGGQGLTDNAIREITGNTNIDEIKTSYNNLTTSITAVQNKINSYKKNVLSKLGGDVGKGLTIRTAETIDPDIISITESIKNEINTGQSALDLPFQIGSNVAEWSETKNKELLKFSYINTAEELRADIKSITRGISGVVVHWTRTFSNMNIGAEQINKTAVQLKEDGIQYNYVIRRDGSLQRGRPLDLNSKHTTKLNHDKKSLSIAFVGGYNCPTGTENPDKYLSSKSLTQAQFKTFEIFCREFYLRYPGGQIIGHNDLDKEFIDPGFDVRDYVDDIFNKKSLFADPSVGMAFEPSEVNITVLP